jgi:hypothetical protein
MKAKTIDLKTATKLSGSSYEDLCGMLSDKDSIKVLEKILKNLLRKAVLKYLRLDYSKILPFYEDVIQDGFLFLVEAKEKGIPIFGKDVIRLFVRQIRKYLYEADFEAIFEEIEQNKIKDFSIDISREIVSILVKATKKRNRKVILSVLKNIMVSKNTSQAIRKASLELKTSFYSIHKIFYRYQKVFQDIVEAFTKDKQEAVKLAKEICKSKKTKSYKERSNKSTNRRSIRSIIENIEWTLFQ